MYIITVKYRDVSIKEKVIKERDYSRACSIVNEQWGPDIKSVHLKEIK